MKKHSRRPAHESNQNPTPPATNPAPEQRDGESEKQSNGEQSDRETEKPRNPRNRDIDDTHDTHEVPPLAARVWTLQEAARIALEWQGGGDVVFNFARAVKAFEVTKGSPLPKGELPGAFSVWWSAAKAINGVLPAGADFEEYLFQFLDSFDRAKTPLGANVIEAAKLSMDKSGPPPEASRYTSPKIVRLVHLCHELQRIAGDAPFFLSVRSAARIIDCPRYETVLAFLNGLERDGILTLVSKGTLDCRRASRFRFNSSNPGNGRRKD